MNIYKIAILFMVSISFSLQAQEKDFDLKQDIKVPEVNLNVDTPITNTIKISAKKDTFITVSKHKKILYNGSIKAGESKEFKTSIPLTIKVSEAENISVSRDGKNLDLKGAKGLVRFNVKLKKTEQTQSATLSLSTTDDTFLKIYYKDDEGTPLHSGVTKKGTIKEFNISKNLTIFVSDAKRIKLLLNDKEKYFIGDTMRININLK